MTSSARSPGHGPRAVEFQRVEPPTLRERRVPVALLVGWALFAVAFGLGLLAGWLIWG